VTWRSCVLDLPRVVPLSAVPLLLLLLFHASIRKFSESVAQRRVARQRLAVASRSLRLGASQQQQQYRVVLFFAAARRCCWRALVVGVSRGKEDVEATNNMGAQGARGGLK